MVLRLPDFSKHPRRTEAGAGTGGVFQHQHKTGYARGGYTLIEVFVAIVIASIVMTIAYGAYLGLHRGVVRQENERLRQLQAERFSETLSRLLRRASITYLSESELHLVDESGKKWEYVWNGESLAYNGDSLPMPLTKVEWVAWGPQLDPERSRWELVERDGDGDGRLDFYELDEDGDGVLSGSECFYLGLLEWTLFFKAGEIAWREKLIVHPRNRVYEQNEENFSSY